HQELQALSGSSAGPTIVLLIALDVASMLYVGLIVLWTGLTYSREYEQVTTDEVGKLHLRRAARQAARAMVPRGWNAYRVPVSALVVLAVGTLLLPLVYPSPAHTSVYAWTLLVLGGILTVASSNTLLKLDMGLLLICFGLRLGYLTQAETVGFFELALFSVVPIVVALVMALLCSLVFARLGTLRLTTLLGQARPALRSASSGASVPKDSVIANDVR
ncbi:MAG: hypothetical protein AVDCRST_MAG93-1936, partial [uncultured Chloroflexia bacterium]